MNRAGKIAVCLAGGLALNAGLRADDIVLSGNPYAPVVARNVFDLNPIVTPDNTQASEPPAKITPNGIMSIFGHLQVLFKVSGATKDGRPVGDESYILAEGQRQDDIEVTHIDQKASIVTFDNHGVVQIIPLANAVASSTLMPGSTPFRNFTSQENTPGGNGNGRFGNRGGSFGGRNRNNANGNDDSQNLQTAPTTRIYQPGQGQQMSPEESAAAILIQTEKYKEEGNPLYKIMPPVP